MKRNDWKSIIWLTMAIISIIGYLFMDSTNMLIFAAWFSIEYEIWELKRELKDE